MPNKGTRPLRGLLSAPRETRRRTRMRPAVQSTSRQRSARSSPCLRPVIAATRNNVRSVGDVGGAQQRLQLCLVEKADFVALLDGRTVNLAHRVGGAPPLAHAVVEHLAEQGDGVVDGLRLGALAAHGGDE